MLDFATKAASCTFFSKIHLQKWHHQQPVNLEDVQETTLTTPFVLFNYMRMSFGLKNTVVFSQLHMKGYQGLRDCFCLGDDIIINSKTRKEHISNMRQVLQALQESGLLINGKSVPELDYLWAFRF
jgi:hypothetical protein